jgi:hypothetical protein
MISKASTAVVEIASGYEEGQAWSLCAYRAMLTRNDQEPEETLCEEFQIGPGPQSGYACLNLGAKAPAGADYFLRSAGALEKDEATAYFYGAISQRVDRVVLEVEGGDEFEATIYEPPPRPGVDYNFFIPFAPRGADVTVRVEGESGATLAHGLFSTRL